MPELYRDEMLAYRDLFDSDLAPKLAEALAKARRKHPDYAYSAHGAWTVIGDELMELKRAIESESEARQWAEAMDVAVTAVRFLLGEHKKHVDKVEQSG